MIGRRWQGFRLVLRWALVLWLLVGATGAPAWAQAGVDEEEILKSTLAAPVNPVSQQMVRARALVQQMSVADRVGQLFMVTFEGRDTAPGSAIADLIVRYRVGGVLLLASNNNFRNEGDTVAQVASLTNRLQALAYRYVLPEANSLDPSADVLVPLPPPESAGPPAAVPITSAVSLPLFIAIDQEGDGPPFARLYNGFTPLPSPMAIGATWDPDLARAVGRVVGRELAAVGINMLLGPSLDVVVTPRPELRGDFGARVFGGDPYWVARMGQAFIAGVHEGSRGRVLTVAKHFPGQGSADRRPDEEVATVAKSLSELRKIELAPFSEVTRLAPTEALTVTDGLLSSHIRYEGFQGNIRERTPPISLAPELQDILALPEFRHWHQEGGILVTDALGARAIKRYKDPTLQAFPYKQVALEAFLAGNDVLLLSQFSLSGTFEEQYANIVDTITYFQERYVQDPVFRERVDEAVTRIVARKLALYPSLALEDVLVTAEDLAQVGKGREVTAQVARRAATLLYPGLQELNDRIPAPPQLGERILFLVDDRGWQECPDCPVVPAIAANALPDLTLALYGPQATNQVGEAQVQALTFSQLQAYLDARARGEERDDVREAFAAAQWVIIAMTSVPADEYPDRDVVSRLLAEGRGLLQGKHVIVFAFNAPYYLDATEISNLTAYYALYSKTEPFLETAVRLLFREFVPTGASPISIPALSYDLRVITEPDPNQTIGLSVVRVRTADDEEREATGTALSLNLGDTLILRTTVIYDRRGHPVPDGTPVVFRLWYPAESLELRKEVTTRDGVAEAAIPLERPGELWISVSSLEARTSTQLRLTIQPGEPGRIETVVPTPTPTATPTPTPSPTPTATPSPTFTPSPTATATPTPTPAPPKVVHVPWVKADALLLALLGLVVVSAVSVGVWRQSGMPLVRLVRWVAWEWILGLGAYVVFGLGIVPGGEGWRLRLGAIAGGVLAISAGLMPLLAWGIGLLWRAPVVPRRR